jgi:hypothetical protein
MMTEEMKRSYAARLCGSPPPLRMMLAPIPRYLEGLVPDDVIQERGQLAFRYWLFHQSKQDLEESYSQELRLMLRILAAEEDKEAIFQAVQDYLNEEEQPRKMFFLR